MSGAVAFFQKIELETTHGGHTCLGMSKILITTTRAAEPKENVAGHQGLPAASFVALVSKYTWHSDWDKP
jgi:hypothetical protein